MIKQMEEQLGLIVACRDSLPACNIRTNQIDRIEVAPEEQARSDSYELQTTDQADWTFTDHKLKVKKRGSLAPGLSAR